jgi:hypothetical protein
MIGATITPTGTPARASASSACSRRCGAAARGSIRRASVAIERRDRQVDARHALRRHRRDDVEVALDERRLGDDRERVLVRGEHFEDRARDPHSRSIGWYGSVLVPSAMGSQR